MDKHVISEHLSELVSGCHVEAAVFTTYNFEPHFFEVDVIPYLLNKTIPFSNDDRVKKYQVMEALRCSDIEIEVFYDRPMFENSDQAPSMEYLFHGVNLLPFAFHAKNIYLLVRNKETEKKSLIFGVGSNNLTKAGWWENIEVQHWEVIHQDSANEQLASQLLEDMSWLIEQRNLLTNDVALEKLQKFLSNCKVTQDRYPISYFQINNKNFITFLRKSLDSNFKEKHWHLEIISPYFVNDPESLLHEQFFNLGVQDIVMLLPIDQDNNALCELQYYETIRNSENTTWGQWTKKYAKALGVDKKQEQYRNLHAKIFHFYNDEESYIFIGSVNFTRNAFYSNVESGFLIRQKKIEPLLDLIPEDVDISCSSQIYEDEINSTDKQRSYYDIYLGLLCSYSKTSEVSLVLHR